MRFSGEQPSSLIESALGADGRAHAEKSQHVASVRAVDPPRFEHVGFLLVGPKIRPVAGRARVQAMGPCPDQE